MAIQPKYVIGCHSESEVIIYRSNGNWTFTPCRSLFSFRKGFKYEVVAEKTEDNGFIYKHFNERDIYFISPYQMQQLKNEFEKFGDRSYIPPYEKTTFTVTNKKTHEIFKQILGELKYNPKGAILQEPQKPSKILPGCVGALGITIVSIAISYLIAFYKRAL